MNKVFEAITYIVMGGVLTLGLLFGTIKLVEIFSNNCTCCEMCDCSCTNCKCEVNDVK